MAKAFGLHDTLHSAIVAQRHAVTLGCLDEVEATLFDALAQLALEFRLLSDNLAATRSACSSSTRSPASSRRCSRRRRSSASAGLALLRRIVDRSTPNDS
jgi:hypothetical protein